MRDKKKAIEIVEKVFFSSFLHFFSLLFLYRYYNYRFMDFILCSRECLVYVRHRLIAWRAKSRLSVAAFRAIRFQLKPRDRTEKERVEKVISVDRRLNEKR